MGPLAKHEDNHLNELKLDVFLKPNNSFNEDQGKLRLSVRFLECPHYREIPPRSELAQDVCERIWYTDEELRYIKGVNTVTVRMMSSGQSMDPAIYCARGLECRTKEGWKQRVQNKQLVRRAVLEEQEMQRSEVIHDPDLFEQVSSEASYQARMEAIQRAHKDEVEARYLESRSDEDDYTDVWDKSLNSFSFFSFLSV